jgi:purine-binding chemotaxis protein CheW
MARQTDDHPLEVLTFGLQGEVFAIEAEIVREILDHISIAEVPRAQPFVSGLINVRGRVVPLADLSVKFSLQPSVPTRDTRIIVIEVDLDGDPTILGILADRVYGVEEVVSASVEEAPRIGMRWRQEFIRGIARRKDDFVIILDIDRVFSTPNHLFTETEAHHSLALAH